MHVLKSARLLASTAVLATIPLMSASAQTTGPTTPPTSPPPAATKPDTTPPAAQRPVIPDKQVTAPKPAAHPLIGLAVFSADGSKLGTVQSVASAPEGKVSAIHIKTGGFLGFGGKLVAIPDGKFTRSGENVQLGMTADEVSKLPEVKEQS